MGKATKTWKIGETCSGGIITVEVNGNTVDIIAKEWDHAAGYRRSSNQSNAKEWDRLSTNVKRNNAEHEMTLFLRDLSTYYWADEIMKYVRSKVKLGSDNPWD